MNQKYLEKLLEHNNWVNLRIIETCSALSDEQLDATPQSVTKGSIRVTLTHLVSSQHNYLSLLTLPVEERKNIFPQFDELKDEVKKSGDALIVLAQDVSRLQDRLITTDRYYVEPAIVFIQIINHATEHREQICSMLNDLGVTPPTLDGWEYGFATNTLVKVAGG
jgi:uncharacterized damage-inducible protein DinB